MSNLDQYAYQVWILGLPRPPKQREIYDFCEKIAGHMGEAWDDVFFTSAGRGTITAFGFREARHKRIFRLWLELGDYTIVEG